MIEAYPNGSIDGFVTKYFETALKGHDGATKSEEATAELFQDVFGPEVKHVGPIGLTPDVLLMPGCVGYQTVTDNKVYHKYTTNSDHCNHMVHNYVGNVNKYSSFNNALAFFSYTTGGFGGHIDNQTKSIADATGANGSTISTTDVTRMVEQHSRQSYSHKKIKDVFSVNRQVLMNDIT